MAKTKNATPVAEAAADVNAETVVSQETTVPETTDVPTETVVAQETTVQETTDVAIETVVEQETTVSKTTDVATNKEDNDPEIAVFPATEKVEESVTEKFDDEVKVLFSEYPDKDAFHFTSDGLAFFQLTDARSHATSLDDKGVISKTRK